MKNTTKSSTSPQSQQGGTLANDGSSLPSAIGSEHGGDLPETNGAVVPIAGTQGGNDALQQKATGDLRPHPLAEQIYGEFDQEEEDNLLESVRSLGILTPLLITRDGTVVAGCQRLRVARELNIESVPVRVLDVSDALVINEVIIESNVARQKTVEQRIKEYRELKRIEAVKAAGRKGKRPDLKANLPSGEAGASRDLAATKVGWSGGTAEKASKVLTAIDDRA